MKQIYLSLTLKKRLLLLLLLFVAAYLMVSVIGALVILKVGTESTPAMRILTVVQDVVMFIFPAVATAMMVTRTPATLLALDRKPNGLFLLWATVSMIASIPAMDLIVTLNEMIPLPEKLEAVFRPLEDNAMHMIEVLEGAHTFPNLIMSVLIVAMMAGLSEELLFRGAFQRLMVTGGVGGHAAVWVAAVVFSMLHLQFYGLVPRILLGAFLGYALLWGRSLWVPVILHALNNTIYIVSQWMGGDDIDVTGSVAFEDVAFACMSAVLSGVGIYMMYRISNTINKEDNHETAE